jgi:prevent-host-death family protein
MQRVVSATEARARFGELIRRVVEGHETIIVERRGKAHVVILSVGEYQRLRRREQQDEWTELVQGARSD